MDQMGHLVRQVQPVLLQVLSQSVSSHYIHNACQLIVVVASLEEGINLEQHASQRAPK